MHAGCIEAGSASHKVFNVRTHALLEWSLINLLILVANSKDDWIMMSIGIMNGTADPIGLAGSSH